VGTRNRIKITREGKKRRGVEESREKNCPLSKELLKDSDNARRVKAREGRRQLGWPKTIPVPWYGGMG